MYLRNTAILVDFLVLKSQQEKLHVEAYLVLLRFVCRYCVFCFFQQIEGLWQPCVEQLYRHHRFFPTVFAHFMSLCYILVILTIFQTVSSLLYYIWDQ